MWALVLSSVVLAAPGEMVARTLDGQETTGTIRGISGGRVVLQTAKGEVTIDPGNILSVAPKQPPTISANSGSQTVVLVDKSRLQVGGYTVTKGRAHFSLGGQAAEVSTRAISVVHFKPLTSITRKQWAGIFRRRDNKEFRGDVIVIRKGENVDPVEGVIYDVTANKVQFDLAGERVPNGVSMERVDGLMYFRAAARKLADPACIVTDTTGTVLRLKNIQLTDGKLQLETLAGLKTTRTLDQIIKLDYSAGKVMYLSLARNAAATDELAPVRPLEWKPCLQPQNPTDAALWKRLVALQKRFNHKKDRWGPDRRLVLGGKSYARGLALWSGDKVDYPLRGTYRRFQATAGIADWAKGGGFVRLTIRGDDKVIWNETLDENDPPKVIDLKIPGVKRLSIDVQYGQKAGARPSDVGDALSLCDAKVTK